MLTSQGKLGAGKKVLLQDENLYSKKKGEARLTISLKVYERLKKCAKFSKFV